MLSTMVDAIARWLPSRSDSLKYFHVAFVSIVATIAWSEAVLYFNNRRLARAAARSGQQHKEEAAIAVACNDASIPVQALIKTVLADSIPDAQIILGSSISLRMTEAADSQNARIWALEALSLVSERSIKFGVGVEVREVDGLKQAVVVIVDGNDETRVGRCYSSAVMPNQFGPDEVAYALNKAWRQLF